VSDLKQYVERRATRFEHQAEIVTVYGYVSFATARDELAGLNQLRAAGYPALDADVARLSAYLRRHINIHGHYTVALPDLGGRHRVLRDPDQHDSGDEEE
jgi:hypothetical protein